MIGNSWGAVLEGKLLLPGPVEVSWVHLADPHRKPRLDSIDPTLPQPSWVLVQIGLELSVCPSVIDSPGFSASVPLSGI